MSDHAYDISYLLDSDAATAEVPVLHVAKAPPRPARSPSHIAAAQAALALELLQAAEAHEDWIRQYVRMYGIAGDGV
ncbi:hypothetical protein ASD55_17285 [Rhodanobacter sp. Root561]|jgi:hypothetical protein|uniref:hypothetical protein n=1 Tax=Rhodanobacter sp. Root561 TaxID=1736560 RepID=UPI0006F9326D|nr:hypothetical protein [Rhodanobacter sp. Root561]KQZ66741.1 hypothetical protein ASD55_17285 [Rhodanobacter sp. Root561]